MQNFNWFWLEFTEFKLSQTIKVVDHLFISYDSKLWSFPYHFCSYRLQGLSFLHPPPSKLRALFFLFEWILCGWSHCFFVKITLKRCFIQHTFPVSALEILIGCFIKVIQFLIKSFMRFIWDQLSTFYCFSF